MVLFKIFGMGLPRTLPSLLIPSPENSSLTMVLVVAVTSVLMSLTPLKHVPLIVFFSFGKGSGYFAVDGNLPSETILP